MNLLAQIRRFLGAWRSGHPAARAGMIRKALRIISGPFDRVGAIGLSAGDSLELPPCVLICSPPRSGSTITYQVVARVLPTAPIINLHMVVPRSARRWRRWLRCCLRPARGFDNYYGHTTQWLDVNEGNEIIDYLFADDNPASIRRRFTEVCAWAGADASHPFVMKNVKVYDRIAALHRAVPELLLLRVRRSLPQVVQSELRGHHDLGTFNPIPPELAGVPWDDPVDFAVRQVVAVERILDRELRQAAADTQIEWHYEGLCGDPQGHLITLARRLGVEPDRLDWSGLGGGLKVSERRKVSDADAERIDRLLEASGYAS